MKYFEKSAKHYGFSKCKMHKIANYEDAIMEKVATRAWKKNYGNLSYENKRKLLNTGVHSYNREHAGLKRGNDARGTCYALRARRD